MASIEAKRQQLQSLYLEVIAADGIQAAHRLLSAALIERRAKDKAKRPKPPVREAVKKQRKPDGPTTIAWKGEVLPLGPQMRRLTEKQKLLVLAMVSDGLTVRMAERVAGYRQGSASMSASVRAAIAEERQRL